MSSKLNKMIFIINLLKKSLFINYKINDFPTFFSTFPFFLLVPVFLLQNKKLLMKKFLLRPWHNNHIVVYIYICNFCRLPTSMLLQCIWPTELMQLIFRIILYNISVVLSISALSLSLSLFYKLLCLGGK